MVYHDYAVVDYDAERYRNSRKRIDKVYRKRDRDDRHVFPGPVDGKNEKQQYQKAQSRTQINLVKLFADVF